MEENKNYNNQQDSFNEIFKQKLENHTLPVEDSLWDEIEKKIHKRKRRNYLGYISISIVAASVIIIFIFTPLIQNNQIEKNPIAYEEIIESSPLIEYEYPAENKTNNPYKSIPLAASNSKKQVLVKEENPKDIVAEEIPIENNLISENLNIDTLSNEISTQDEIINADIPFFYEPLMSTANSHNTPMQFEGKEIKSLFSNDWAVGMTSNIMAYNKSLPSSRDLDASSPNQGGNWQGDNPGNVNSGEHNTTSPTKPLRFDPDAMHLPDDSYNATHSPEVSFGFVIQRKINNYVGIETGVMYTYLRSKFKNEDISLDAEQNLYYLGVPLYAVITPWDYKRWDFYFSAGGMLEKGIKQSYHQNIIYKDETYSNEFCDNISGVQWSLRASIGATFKITRHIGIYLSPQIAYYFDNDQPQSMRSKNPLSFGMSGGVRYKF